LNHEPFRKAFEIANRANMTKEEWEAYDATSVRMQDERGIAIAARKEGEQIGQQRGEQIGQQRILRALQQKGHGKEQMADMTGLSIEEIERLLA
jgi:predicted transposase/invertase (TIGR01784 family)